MKVSLVSLTQSNIEGVLLTPEQLIVYVARVSNPSNQLNSESSDKLISYLIKNKHWSPFEMADMTVEIVTSRGIAQQILRHRSFSFQEFSQRYAEVTDMEPIQLRLQAVKNRQSSEEEFNPTLVWTESVPYQEGFTEMEVYSKKADEAIKDYIEYGEEIYKKLIEAGVAKECARFILPITTQTKIYMKGSIRSWIHYLQIRDDEHAQLEHRQIAIEIKKLFKENFSFISQALNW